MIRHYVATVRVSIESEEGISPRLDDIRTALESSVGIDIDTEEGYNTFGDESEHTVSGVSLEWETLRGQSILSRIRDRVSSLLK